MTEIATILLIFSPILCVLVQFYAIFQDFLLLSGFSWNTNHTLVRKTNVSKLLCAFVLMCVYDSSKVGPFILFLFFLHYFFIWFYFQENLQNLPFIKTKLVKSDELLRGLLLWTPTSTAILIMDQKLWLMRKSRVTKQTNKKRATTTCVTWGLKFLAFFVCLFVL